MGGREPQDQESRLLYDLCALALGLLRSPAPPAPRPVGRPPRASPAGLVSLLLGVSTTLMLSGSVAFAIGLVLMPWVIGMAMVLYVFGAVWDLSAAGRSIIFPAPRAAGLAAGGGVGVANGNILSPKAVIKDFHICRSKSSMFLKSFQQIKRKKKRVETHPGILLL